VQAVNGFNQAVSVSFTGLPRGVSTSPALPVMISPGSPKTITLNAASSASAGVQNISVMGTSGSLNHSASFAVSVADPSYAYLATGYPGQPPYDLVGFSVDANSGALAQVPGSPISLSAEPVDLAIATETGGAFVFALIPDSASGTVALQSYRVDSATGALTALQTINYPPNTNQSLLAVHPSQSFLYVLQDGCLLAYLIDPATGNLTQASCSSLLASGPNHSFVVAPPGNYAYELETDPLPESFFIYQVSQSDGSVTPILGLQFNFGGTLFTDPQGRALYQIIGPLGVGSCGQFAIWQIDPNSGVVNSVNTSFSPLCEPLSMAFNPADTFGYVTSGPGESQSANGIYVGAADATTGNLTNISSSPFAVGTAAQFGAVEPSQGKFLLQMARNSSTGEVLVYAIQPSTGALSQVTGVQATLPSDNVYVLKMLMAAPQP